MRMFEVLGGHEPPPCPKNKQTKQTTNEPFYMIFPTLILKLSNLLDGILPPRKLSEKFPLPQIPDL